MNKQERLKHIRKLLDKQATVKVADMMQVLDIDRTTIYRDFKALVQQGELTEVSKGVYTQKISALRFLETTFFSRPKKNYNPDFLNRYIPNKTSFFQKEQLKTLEKSVNNLDISTDFYHGNKRLLEITLIDLSFASSYLEGNTYDYLDTEVLIKYNEIAQQKSQDDTQMILNHKKCIEYMIYYSRELPFSRQTFFEIHSLLGEKLLAKDNLGTIRNKIVEIGASAYTPLDNKQQLEEQFAIFLDKLNVIENPFEQSLFILVFLPYFQLFLDVNKRTSRMSCNLPLLKNHLPLISLLAVDKRSYINAILAVYELNDVTLLSHLFVENYLLNMKRYL